MENSIGWDWIILAVTALTSLELNLPYSLDQLNFHHALPLMGPFASWLCPGGENQPLILMGNGFMPYKLLIRTLTTGAVALWLAMDLMRHTGRRTAIVKGVLIGFLIAGHVIVPQLMMIRARVAASNHALAHDGGTIQMEEAMKMVLSGKNPYSETFHGTPLENWRGFTNNVVYHVPYMPGAFLYSLPAYMIIQSMTGMYDQRLLHLLLFLVSFALIGILTPAGTRRHCAWLLFGLNPFFVRYFLLGANDIVIIFLILLSAALIHRSHPAAGLLALAAACSVKQFAWFFVPFFMVRALPLDPETPSTWFQTAVSRWTRWIPALSLAALTILPFVLWNPVAFYQDTFLYGSGGLESSYPIQGFHGYGFATLLLFFRIIPNGDVYFPFIIIQLAVLVPLFIVLWSRFRRETTLAEALRAASVLLFVFMFFSRYLHANFIGFILLWPILAACMAPVEDRD